MNVPDLTVALCPLEIAHADPEKNLSRVLSAIHRLPSDVSLLLLPELFSTGFIEDSEEIERLSLAPAIRCLEALSSVAAGRHMAIAGSILMRDPQGRPANTGFFIDPDILNSEGYPSLTTYPKRHLFNLSNEARTVIHGRQRPPLISFRGWVISLIVCYDLRFPAWCRNNPDTPYDLMLVPANWPDKRAYPWHQLLIARAIENQAVWIGVDCLGSDRFGSYSPSMTAAYSCMGRPIPATEIIGPDDKNIDDTDIIPDIRIVTLNHAEILTARQRFPVLLDADPLSLPL